MGDMADDYAHQQWQENSRWHHELNPRGYKTSDDFVWTTRDGVKMKLGEMTSSHIENCLRLLKRTLSERPADIPYMGNSDYAEQAVESEQRHNDDLEADLEETIAIMSHELSQRLAETGADDE